MHWLGIGGYRSGALLAGGILAATGGGPAAVLIRRSDGGWRVASVIALVVVGFVAGAHLATIAPLSKGRLVELLDEVDAPFFEPIRTQQTGDSRCSRHCPVVERTYRGPNIGHRQSVLLMLVALHLADLAPDPSALDEPREKVVVTGPDYDLVVRGTRVDDDDVHVSVRLMAKRR